MDEMNPLQIYNRVKNGTLSYQQFKIWFDKQIFGAFDVGLELSQPDEMQLMAEKYGCSEDCLLTNGISAEDAETYKRLNPGTNPWVDEETE